MKLEEVKRNLNKKVKYMGSTEYLLTACILRKGKNGFFYQAELQDLKSGRTVIYCKLEDLEVIECEN